MESIPGCESVGSIQKATPVWTASSSRTTQAASIAIQFSSDSRLAVRGLGDVLNTVEKLQLPRFPYEKFVKYEELGEGETFWVEKCQHNKQFYALKHLKLESKLSDTDAFQHRLNSVLLELRIMHHQPLKSHPNILSLFAYGWNSQKNSILPYMVVEYSSFGTLRKYLERQSKSLPMLSKEIFLADIASGLSALHATGIIHGDVKLDNTLIFQSWERPTGVIVKLSDFGHSKILNVDNKESFRYSGTLMYNAPETFNQVEKPIQKEDLQKCDNWAFGLLALEVLLDGTLYSARMPFAEKTNDCTLRFDSILNIAQQSIGSCRNDIQKGFFRSMFRQLLQTDPKKRISDLLKLGILSKWNTLGTVKLSSQLALHSGSAEWSYEIFRPQGTWIPWEHQLHIANEFKRCHEEFKSKPSIASSAACQVAFCYFQGFGFPVNYPEAFKYLESAITLGHPMSPLLEMIIDGKSIASRYCQQTEYSRRLVSLLKTSEPHPEDHPAARIFVAHPKNRMTFVDYPDFLSWTEGIFKTLRYQDDPSCLYLPSICQNAILFQDESLLQRACKFSHLTKQWNDAPEPIVIQACKTGNARLLNALLDAHFEPFEEDSHGCTVLHWLFLLEDHAKAVAERLAKEPRCSSVINKPSNTIQLVHRQWPLQLTGTPLAFATSVGSASGVKALLEIGANPLAHVHHAEIYPSDHRRYWTALHVAVKYHNITLLNLLCNGLDQYDGLDDDPLASPPEPLSCALSFSSFIERKALHGSYVDNAFLVILQAITSPNPLVKTASDTTTALEQAICFNDLAVISTLLTFDSSLASSKLALQQGIDSYTYPFHFAAKLASHRDSVDTLDVLKLLKDKFPSCVLQRDSEEKTPLHFAVDGMSIRPAAWLLQMEPRLLNAVDKYGKTALYYCNATEIAELLLSSGADVNHRAHGLQAPLHYFAETGAGNMVSVLCKHGSDKDLLNQKQQTPLCVATMSGCREAVVALAAAGASVNIGEESGITPLLIAIRSQRHDLTEILLNNDAELWSESSHGPEALHVAITTNNIHACKLLLKSPEEGWSSDHDGNTPLHTGARFGNSRTMSLLTSVYSQESQINQPNCRGETPLHVAAFYGQPGPASVLIEAKGDPNARRKDGSNAIHCAIQGSAILKSGGDEDNRLALYKLLISGTSILAVDNKGYLPWDKAVQHEDLAAIYLILRSGLSEAYREVRFLTFTKQTAILQDASHLIFHKAALCKKYWLLRELLFEGRMGNDCIILDDVGQKYVNTRNPSIKHKEARHLYLLAKEIFDSTQRYPLRAGEHLQKPIPPGPGLFSDIESGGKCSIQ